MSKLTRRAFSRSTMGLAVAAAALSAAPAQAQAPAAAWPDKPVRVVVPAPPGSSLDLIVRGMSEGLKSRWGQPLVVENKPGAGGTLGMDVVAKAPADGYTLGIGFNGPIAFGPFMFKKMPYDPARDLLPVVMTSSQPNVLAVSASVPASNVREFVAWAKTQGDKVSYASVGPGSSSHLSMELLKSAAGFNATHVPFNGSPPAALSVAQGETQALMAVESGVQAMVQSGRVKIIGVTSAQRLPFRPDLPTVAESGVPGFEAMAWNGLFAPAGTPAAVVSRINADVNAVMAEAAFRDAMTRQGMIPGGGSPAQFKSFIESEGRKWGEIIRKAGIQLD